MERYARAAAAVGLAAASAAAARALLGVPDVEMLFLLAVVVVAATASRGATLVAAVLSVAAYDFLFVPPPLTFDVADARYLLTFAMMFGIGLLVSTLADRLRARDHERARLAEEAREARVRAGTEEQRSALLSSVSHDLRTPLAAITGAATTLRDDPGIDAATRRDLADTVCEEAERLERLVANLLDMTRLESGAVTPNREWVPLLEVVGSALARVERLLAGREVKVDVPDVVPLLSIDPILVQQLFVNLLENAAKYTPPGSEIGIHALVEGSTLVVDVADRGAGIPAGEEERVFERFHRAGHAAAHGSGLGLSIARAIAQAHGGRLTGANRPGGGAVFRLALPILEPPAAPPDPEERPPLRRDVGT
jgi:two-component system sensor histidine kinase KdpD